MIVLTMPGTDIDLNVIRKGRRQSIKVKLRSISETETTELTQHNLIDKLSLAVQDLVEEFADQLCYNELKGVLVSNVKLGNPAAFVGFRPGILIIEANRLNVKIVSELVRALEASHPSKKVFLLVRDRSTTRFVSFSIE